MQKKYRIKSLRLPTSVLTLTLISFLLAECGRSWKGFRLEEGVLPLNLKSGDIYVIKSPSFPDFRQWDFLLDENDFPHVAIWDTFQGALFYLYLDLDGNWKSESIDPPETIKDFVAGKNPSIFFVGDKLHIVYLSSSTADKVPKYYLLKEAFKDSQGLWRCRVIKKWETEIPLVKAGYLPQSKKVAVVFFDSKKKGIVIGSFTPGEERNKDIKICSQQVDEKENSDFSYGYIYYFGQSEQALKNQIDPSCNPLISKESFSLDFLSSFTRNRIQMTGIALYDPIDNRAFWIEFKQTEPIWPSDISTYTTRLESSDRIFIAYDRRDPELNQCVPAMGALLKVSLPQPFRIVQGVYAKTSEDTFSPVTYYVKSPSELYLHSSLSYPTEVSVVYYPLFRYEAYPFRENISHISAGADRFGNIHIAYYLDLRPSRAVEYGMISKIRSEDGEEIFTSRFVRVDGGGKGIYQQGTAGVSLAVTDDGMPVIAYFSPFTADLKVSIPLYSTWISIPKTTGSISGTNPKITLSRRQTSAFILFPSLTEDKLVVKLLIVPITL